MTDRAQIESVLREAYAARKRGDIDGITKVFADRPHFELAGAVQASPIPVRCTDPQAFQALMAGLVKTFQFLDQEILTMVIEDTKAAVHWRGRIRSTITGEDVVTELVDLVTVENGRITSFIEFCDTALAARLMGADTGAREAVIA